MALLLALQVRSEQYRTCNGDAEYWLILRQIEGKGAVWERVGITLIELLPGALTIQLPRRDTKIV